jgi:signal transduction histidine kinase
MQRRLLLSYLTITLLVLLLLEIPLGVSYARAERRRLTTALQHDALALVFRVEDRLEAGDVAALQAIAREGRRRVGGRVVIVDRKGVVLADSEPPPRAALDRPLTNASDIRTALAGREVAGTRHVDALGADFLSVAEPITTSAGGGAAATTSTIGVVRVSYPLSVIDARIRDNWLLLAGIAVAVLLVVFFVSLTLARSVTRPVRELESAADQLGRGDLSARAVVAAHPPELRVLAQSFNRTASHLEQLVHSQQAFIADASHQLRTPLAALRLRLENVQHEAAPTAVVWVEDLDGALAEVARLSRIVDGLLELAHAERQAPAPDDVDVGDVVRRREAAWSAFAVERDVRIDVTIEGRCIARATPGRLEQVLENLLNNAVEVAPPHTDVSLSARDDGDWVVVDVADAGPGMSEAAMARAFDRFWRETGQTRGGGSGLGLTIVEHLVRSDAGTVALARSSQGGLQVTVRLPAAGQPGGRRDQEPAAASGRRWPTRVRPAKSANV